MLGELGPGDFDAKFSRVVEFFESAEARAVPYARISALFWASLARDIRAGRKPDKFPTAGMFNDIDVVAAYAPFCDALFVDKEIAHFAMQGELRRELAGGARLFSLRQPDLFFVYLEEIEAQAPADHLKTVNDLYGPDWAKPYLAILGQET